MGPENLNKLSGKAQKSARELCPYLLHYTALYTAFLRAEVTIRVYKLYLAHRLVLFINSVYKFLKNELANI